ncbi:MAG: PfkB family carbohydrate kinase [Vicinamibacterales bacterium]
MTDIVKRFARARVLVIGDLIADEYVYGRVARVSREAPVLILEHDSTEVVPGGAGNAAANVAALGAEVRLVSLAGRDEPGRRLQRAFSRRVDRRGLVRPAVPHPRQDTHPRRRHPFGQAAGGPHRSPEHPRGHRRRPSGSRARRRGGGRPRRCRADLRLRFRAGHPCAGARGGARGRPPGAGAHRLRYALTRYRGLTACAPNESEVEEALGVRIDDDPRVLERAGRQLLDDTRMKAVVVTRGSRGMAVFQPGTPTVHIPIFGSDQIADVTGAGDTVMAALTLGLAAGAGIEASARLANVAGGLVVMKRGTATVSAAELMDALTRA